MCQHEGSRTIYKEQKSDFLHQQPVRNLDPSSQGMSHFPPVQDEPKDQTGSQTLNITTDCMIVFNITDCIFFMSFSLLNTDLY